MGKIEPIRESIVRLPFLLLLVLFSSQASAQGTGPSLDKCTCHFIDGSDPAQDGAAASNATLCVQTLDKMHHWCEITVACLRGNQGPSCGSKSDPKSALQPLFKQHVDSMRESKSAFAMSYRNTDLDYDAVLTTEKYDEAELNACYTAYLSNGPDESHAVHR